MAETGAAQANIGVVGLAVMGSNLARNLASREGNTVAIDTNAITLTGFGGVWAPAALLVTLATS